MAQVERQKLCDEQEYYNNIKNCADNKIDQLIVNGHVKHAVYLMKEMFSHAEREIRLFTGKLPDVNDNGIPVYITPELIMESESFLRKEGSRLEILVQDSDFDINNSTFIKNIQKKLVDGKIKGTVRIFKSSESLDVSNHFMVMDKVGYRLEFDDLKTEAVANFNDNKFASELADFFDSFCEMDGTTLMPIVPPTELKNPTASPLDQKRTIPA